MLKTKDFYYDLPEELIAQTPVYPRDSSRLMVYDRENDMVCHEHFYDLPKYLKRNTRKNLKTPELSISIHLLMMRLRALYALTADIYGHARTMTAML